MENRGQRVKRQGVVTSDVMDKTITVSVERQFSHPLYKRTVRRTKKFLAHDENSQAKVGDRVEIIEARPYSKRKRWKLVRIIEAK
jgi:small subunit ribosomal protein S17